MKINDNLNYCILANNVNKIFLSKFASLPILESDYSYESLKEKLEFFPTRQVVFNETWYFLKDKEKKDIMTLLNKQNIKYINITSDIENALYADYIIIYDNEKIIIEGPKESVLREERLLKRIGFGLPFVVDLSTQLNYYDIFDEIYYDVDKLIGDLWN